MGPGRIALVCGLVLLSACGRHETPQASPPPAADPGVAALRDAGDAAINAREFEQAVATYRKALAVASDDVALRFRLASALTHLGRHAEAADEFRWITAHGPASAREVALAREWLAAAGRSAVEDAAAPATATSGAAPATGRVGRVRGDTSWTNVAARDVGPITVALFLVPDHPSGPDDFLATHTRLGQPYAFDRVPPGRYRLRAEANFVRVWDVSVTVPVDGESVVDLSEKNAEVSDREFP